MHSSGAPQMLKPENVSEIILECTCTEEWSLIRIGRFGMIDDLAAVSLCGFDSVKTNAIINGKINAKRLKFKFKTLRWNKKYISDVISTIPILRERNSQAIGTISEICSILTEISLGYHYVKLGLILRETNLLSRLLLSCESWHKLYKCQIEALDK